ncbi:MAG: hypothetical protein L3J54_14350 [Draconibacterium sp.]|nr:hypothetical protein [Draconibacterium sp.]
MENKKLLKFLLRDLRELEELIVEKDDNTFDELEMEFLQTRVSGAKRMIQILFDEEKYSLNEKSDKPEIITPKEVEIKQEIAEEPVIIEDKTIPEVETKVEETEPEIRDEVEEALDRITEEVDEVDEAESIDLIEEQETEPEIVVQNEVNLDDDKDIDEANHRLGDSFSKEKSINDLIDNEDSKLDHKISNRPVESIKKAIGINDRFQYIRELFEGNAEKFIDTVAELDEKTDINEAVDYLKKNFKWKKNETSLKFVNLVKRRFHNE